METSHIWCHRKSLFSERLAGISSSFVFVNETIIHDAWLRRFSMFWWAQKILYLSTHLHTHTPTVAAAPSGVFFLFFFPSCFLLLKLNKIKTADAHRSLCNFKGFAIIASLSLGPFKKPHYEPHGETRSKNTVVNKREYIQNSAINVSEILNIFPNFRNKIKLGKLNN